jgi:flagellar basal-body rod protein FlgC
MSLFSSLEISASALNAERQRAEVVASNMANAETTKTDQGGPYRRKEVVFATSGGLRFPMLISAMARRMGNAPGMVRVQKVAVDPAPPVLRYEPQNPDANAQGYVAYPNINPVQEMVDLMSAVRAYQLNASAITASKQMIQQSIDILKA